jgi:hypothetical protein
VKRNVLGEGKFEPEGKIRQKTTYNAAETAPGAWEMLKQKWKKQAKEKKKRAEEDRAKW